MVYKNGRLVTLCTEKKTLTCYAFLFFPLCYDHRTAKDVDIAVYDIFFGSAGDYKQNTKHQLSSEAFCCFNLKSEGANCSSNSNEKK